MRAARLLFIPVLITSSAAALAQEAASPPDGPLVVSGSKAPQTPLEVPAATTVVTERTIETAASRQLPDLLHLVPGVNVAQLSARHFNVTGRAAAGLLGQQLVLVDGRPLYQDSVGFVFWDLASIDSEEVKQIEIVRGPASAVWGANAHDGVINIVTKSPRELEGSSFTIGTGLFERTSQVAAVDSGRLFYMSGHHAQALSDRWAYKISAGAYTQDALARPTGIIDETLRWPHPRFTNEGTRQPKFDARVDYTSPDNRRRLQVSGGAALTEGMWHTELGPFALDGGSRLRYARASYQHGGVRANYFSNQVLGDASNRLMRDNSPAVLGRRPEAPLLLDFEEQTHQVDAWQTLTVATRHVLTYGGTWRHNTFDISLLPFIRNPGRLVLPIENSRSEGGLYVEDVFRISRRISAVLNGRIDHVDDIDYLSDIDDETMFSPRAALIVNPAAAHAVRVAYSGGYRTASMLERFFEASLAEPIDLGVFHPLLAGSIVYRGMGAHGNQRSRHLLGRRPVAPPIPTVREFELGYTGYVRRAALSAAFHVTRTRDEVAFTVWSRLFPEESLFDPDLPDRLVGLLPGGSLPRQLAYRTLGDVTRKGLDIEVNTAMNNALNVFANYTWQSGPNPLAFDNPVFRHGGGYSEVWRLSVPPRHRLNGGMTFNSGRWLGSASVSFTDQAFWRDVLDERYHGATDAYTLVNAGLGIRWGGNRLMTAVKVVNLLNQQTPQHIFGDIIGRQVVGELRMNWSRRPGVSQRPISFR